MKWGYLYRRLGSTLTYKTEVFDSSNNWLNGMKVSYVKGSYIIHGNDITWLLENGYKKIQLVYVPIEAKDREILGQGFLTGTVAHVGNRMGNSPFAYPDYLARPDRSLQSSSSIIYENEFNKATPIEWEHFRPLSFLTNPEHYTIPGYSKLKVLLHYRKLLDLINILIELLTMKVVKLIWEIIMIYDL